MDRSALEHWTLVEITRPGDSLIACDGLEQHSAGLSRLSLLGRAGLSQNLAHTGLPAEARAQSSCCSLVPEWCGLL